MADVISIFIKLKILSSQDFLVINEFNLVSRSIKAEESYVCI